MLILIYKREKRELLIYYLKYTSNNIILNSALNMYKKEGKNATLR